MMTKFEKDYAAIKAEALDAREILEKRKKELDSLKQRARECRNGFIYEATMQELERRQKEYDKLYTLI